MSISVAIIIPAFNVESYLDKCLASVVAQTYRGPIECIIVDDCSTDRTSLVAEEIISKYLGPITFRLVKQDRNEGVSVARNRGISLASSDYIFFLDGDDMIIPQCIEWMVDKVEEHPGCQCVYAGFSSEDTNLALMDYADRQLKPYSNDAQWIRCAVLNRYYFTTSPCNRLVLRSLLVENKVYFYPGIRYEDELWNFELSKHLKSIATLPHNTYMYVPHAQSFVHSVLPEDRWSRILLLCQLILERLSPAPINYMEIHAVWTIINDTMLFVPIPKSSRVKIQQTLYRMSKIANFGSAIRLRLYSSLLNLPRPFYRNLKAQHYFKRYFELNVD